MSFKEIVRKFLPPLAALAAVVAVLFYIASQQRAAFVPLPGELKILILVFLTGVVTRVLVVLTANLGIDLVFYADEVAAALAGVVIVLIESYLRLIPLAYDAIMVTVWHLVVLIIGAVGVVKVLAKTRVPGFN